MTLLRTVLLFAFLIFAVASSSQADSVSFELTAGTTHPVGDFARVLDRGFTFGGGVFSAINSNISVGARLSYSGFALDEAAAVADSMFTFEFSYVSSGSAYYIEFVPTVRLATREDAWINVFAEAGFGVFALQSDAEVRTVRPRTASVIEAKRIFENETSGGFVLGGGFLFGNPDSAFRVGVYPRYQVVLNEKKTEYYSVNLGVNF